MQTASAQYHSDQIHGQEPKRHTKLKALLADALKELQNDHTAQKRKGLVKETVFSVGTAKNCNEWSSTRSCSSAAYCAVWHDDLTEGNEKRRKTAACARLPHGQETPISQEGNQRGKSTAGKGQSPSCAFQQRGRCRSGTNCRIAHLSKDGQSSSPDCQAKSDKIKGLQHIAQKGGNSEGSRHGGSP